MTRITLIAVALAACLSAAAAADDDVHGDDWAFYFRIGGLSTNHDARTVSYTPRVSAGFEFVSYRGSRSALSVALDGQAFAGDHIAMVPITLSYRYFPIGNGNGKTDARPYLLPWVGAGGGLFLSGPSSRSVASVLLGAHFSGGVLVRINHLFEINTELRYTLADDLRMFNYMMGFGFRF